MSFLFSRTPSAEPPTTPDHDRDQVQGSIQALVEAQSITASAIFAALVSKGVLSPDEAAGYMSEIAGALRNDVSAPVGPDASDLLEAYAQALTRAGG